MTKQKVVVLSGAGPADHWLDAPFSLLQSFKERLLVMRRRDL